jgi:hypothetical protein
MVEKIGTYNTRKTIVIGQESYYIALPARFTGSANAVIKAGEPVTGDIENRDAGFSASTSNAVGIALHEVKLDADGKGNGTILLAGCVDLLKLDSTVASHVASAKSDLDKIIFVKGSAI